MLPDYFDFQVRSRIIAGPGYASRFGKELERFGAARAFIICDRVVAGKGLLDGARASLAKAGIAVAGCFDDVPPNSEFAVVRRCAAACREAGADLLVAVGGGSVIDTAKAANIVLALGGDIAEWQGFGLIDRPLPPLVAIPTTAGTGSEVTAYAVIRDHATASKQTFVSPYIAADLAVLDPQLTMTMPGALTASTGLDALTHAVEAYLSTNWRPISDGLAVHACQTIARWLPRAVAAGDDIQARYHMLVASCEAGMAFSSAMVGCVHAMAHALGGLFEVPHGLANAVLLGHGVAYNLPAAAGRIARLARPLGVESEDARAVVDFLRRLPARLGLPARLRDLGVPADGLARAAEAACLDAAVYTNPREATPEELLAVLQEAY